MAKKTREFKRGRLIYLMWFTCQKCSWSLLTQARTYACADCKGNRLTHKTVVAAVVNVEEH